MDDETEFRIETTISHLRELTLLTYYRIATSQQTLEQSQLIPERSRRRLDDSGPDAKGGETRAVPTDPLPAADRKALACEGPGP